MGKDNINNNEIIRVEPHNEIFKELGQNNYSQVDLFGELIDNSIAGRTVDQLNGFDSLNITIKIINYSSKGTVFSIEDNGTGIEIKKIPNVIAPAGTSGGNSLNEHGLGMKQAIASLGELYYLETKVEGNEYANRVNDFNYGNVIVDKIEKPKMVHYTKLVIKECNPILTTKGIQITKTVVPWLGAKYRRYLNDSKNKVNISIELIDGNESDDEIVDSWKVKEVHPNYFGRLNRQNKPEIEAKVFKGTGWEIKLTFGFAPTDEEYESLGIEKPKNYEPYHVALSKQGLDIIKDDRVINFTQLSEIGLVPRAHNQFNSIRGEIDLIKGFPTSSSKNYIIRGESWLEMIAKVKMFLKERGFLSEGKIPSTGIPEKIYRDRLAKQLRSNKRLYDYKNVNVEVAVGKLNGLIDVVSDDTIWELKKDEAKGLDVFQCFAYMVMGEYAHGMIVAKEVSSGAKEAVDFVNKQYHCDIKWFYFSDYNIDQNLSEEELKKI